MRCAYIVGSAAGFPPEAWVVFASEREARRHADAAAYEFQVFPLPVYDSYDDLPPSLRVDAPIGSLRYLSAADESAFARLIEAEMPAASAAPVFAASDIESTSVPEIRALYETEAEAQRHAALAPGALSVLELPVFATYVDCPPELRFDQLGPGFSQLIRPRWSNRQRPPW